MSVVVAVAAGAVAVVAVVIAAFLLLSPGPQIVDHLVYGPLTPLSSAGLADLENASAAHISVYASNQTVWVHGLTASLVVVLSPSDHDDQFAVGGLANPTVHVRKDVRLTVTLVNADTTDTHSWAVSNAGPPYSSTPMMGWGSGMHLWGSMMLGEASADHFWSQNMSFSMPVDGSFWYFCMHYGHAADGMYGSIVVG